MSQVSTKLRLHGGQRVAGGDEHARGGVAQSLRRDDRQPSCAADSARRFPDVAVAGRSDHLGEEPAFARREWFENREQRAHDRYGAGALSLCGVGVPVFLDLAFDAKRPPLHVDIRALQCAGFTDAEASLTHCREQRMELGADIFGRREELCELLRIERYAIVDDDGDMLDEQRPYFVQTNAYVGMTDADADKLIAILGEVLA